MIVSRCPVRISLAGGSTDLDDFIMNHGRGAVVSFSANLYTYITVFRDRFGQNEIDRKYNVVWSRTENTLHREKIKNDIARIVMMDFDADPVHCWFTADVSSTGSGLASSSSHILAAVQAFNELEGRNLTKQQVIKKAWILEKRFNPLTGFQDPYGCATGGLNYHEKLLGKDVISTSLDASIFKKFKMFLLPTNFSRSSTSILNTIKKTVDKRLLDMADEARFAISVNDRNALMEVVREGWNIKKNSSNLILGNKELIDLDKKIHNHPSVLAHRLIGAGNGGYFLLFVNNDVDKEILEKDFAKTVLSVSIDYNGITSMRM